MIKQLELWIPNVCNCASILNLALAKDLLNSVVMHLGTGLPSYRWESTDDVPCEAVVFYTL